MEHFVEAILELLFSFAKKKPEERPDIELKNEFTVGYSIAGGIVVLLLTFLGGVLFLVLSLFMDSDIKILFYFLSALLFISFILFLFLLSIRCKVTPERIEKSTLLFFKKEILWDSVFCVRTIEKEDDSSITIALYNYDRICVLDVSSDMENAWCIVKMAESKNLEIREDKNVPFWKINKL